jgi:ABC-2 type transport system ATP-binding protein
MLTARQLTKRFGATVALDALDLAVAPGEIFCLLGANGAGKTTTINCFLGFVAPDAGAALVDGVDTHTDPVGARRRLAYVPEQVALYPRLTGLENLAYFTALGGAEPEEGVLRSRLAQAGLPPAAHDERVAGYSKGMRQKVGLALALAREARALLLDEPTSGLDPAAAHEFGALLQRLRDGGVAVLMATHDLFHAHATGTRVGIMRRGRLVATRDVAGLPLPELERLYLDAVRD